MPWESKKWSYVARPQQANRRSRWTKVNNAEPMIPSKLPERPWQKIMVGEIVQNSQSLYSFTFSALIDIHEYIYSHSTTEFTFKKSWFIYIYLCIFYSRLYLLTFTRCLHSLSTSYIHSHSRSKYSFNIFCAPPLRIGQYKISTADYGLRTTDWV